MLPRLVVEMRSSRHGASANRRAIRSNRRDDPTNHIMVHDDKMHLCWCIHIDERNTSICGLSFRNRELCFVFGSGQLFVSIASLLQVVLFFNFLRNPIVYFSLRQRSIVGTTQKRVENWADYSRRRNTLNSVQYDYVNKCQQSGCVQRNYRLTTVLACIEIALEIPC
ncbi:hypothetical protein AB6A40_010023 [Gnathostoma spinigerum]|uniref:Uncharacterized protein n=1 Tax=Gnathostoma spinigerum TaxID=75299 RepID=A0ABD6F0P8_9BILA